MAVSLLEHRENPGSNPLAAVSKFGQFRSLYATLFYAAWLNDSQRSQVGVGMTTRVKCKAL